MADQRGTDILENYVKEFRNIVPEDLCDAIIDEYSNCDDWRGGETGSGLWTDVRNVDEIHISDAGIIRDSQIRRELDDRLFKSIESVPREYHQQFRHFTMSIDTGYQLLRYNEGQFYTQHVDMFGTQQRSLSCSLILNDDYEGGEFSFWDDTKTYNPSKGSALVFPSNFLYPHQIKKITKGQRYSIITWFI